MNLKRRLSLLAVLALLAGLLTTMPVFAETSGGAFGGEDGGDNLTWTLDGQGTLTISGKGKMPDWVYLSSAPWDGQRNYIQKISIEDGVTSIGAAAFASCKNLTSVAIPGSVTSIGEYAFAYCDNLTDIDLPNGIISIGTDAFWLCTQLTNVSLPDTLVTIGENAFGDCEQLTGSINLPNGVTSIGEYAFANCALTEVTIPDSVASIGAYAFYRCPKLTSISVSDGNPSYSSMDGNLFDKHKTTLIQYAAGKRSASYSIPNSVTSIGKGAFANCHLTGMDIPDSVTSIEAYAFSICRGLRYVILPDGITSIAQGTFSFCEYLNDIGIPDSVTSIEASAFGSCKTLVSVAIPGSVTSIGDDAFAYCDHLTNVAIPNSVMQIGARAFSGCTSLAEVYYEGSAELWGRININPYNDPLTNARIRYNARMPKSVKSISLNKSSTELRLGTKETLTIAYTPADAGDKTVVWNSTDEGVVQVKDGILIPVAKGTATVTVATLNGKRASCRVTVLPAEYIEKIEVTAKTESTITVSLSTVQVPDGSMVYLTACNNRGPLLSMAQAQVQNNTAQGTVTTTNANQIKVFIWDPETLRPITDPESIPYKHLQTHFHGGQ